VMHVWCGNRQYRSSIQRTGLCDPGDDDHDPGPFPPGLSSSKFHIRSYSLKTFQAREEEDEDEDDKRWNAPTAAPTKSAP